MYIYKYKVYAGPKIGPWGIVFQTHHYINTRIHTHIDMYEYTYAYIKI